MVVTSSSILQEIKFLKLILLLNKQLSTRNMRSLHDRSKTFRVRLSFSFFPFSVFSFFRTKVKIDVCFMLNKIFEIQLQAWRLAE